jgi:hypothetical protein
MSAKPEYHSPLARKMNQSVEIRRSRKQPMIDFLTATKIKLENNKLALSVTISSIAIFGAYAIIRSRSNPQKFIKTEVEQSPRDPNRLIARISKVLSPTNSEVIWPRPEEIENTDPEKIPGETSKESFFQIVESFLADPSQKDTIEQDK